MKLYQCLQAYTAQDIEQRIANAIALGYIPIGGISAKREEHNIMGSRIVLRQSLLYAPLVHSDSDSKEVLDTASRRIVTYISKSCVTQRQLLESVVDNATNCDYSDDGTYRFCEVDTDIIEVIEAHLRGDAE